MSNTQLKLSCTENHVYNLYTSLGNREDSGVDLYFPDDVVVPAGKTVLIDFKVVAVFTKYIQETNTTHPLPFFLLPRSSIYKTPLRMANSVGLIDRGYRNTLKVPVDNRSNEDYTIQSGTRLFQIAQSNLTYPDQVLCDNEPYVDKETTQRGLGGFGSTGT